MYVLNGDELIDADLAALLDAHRAHGGAATLVVAPLPTGFGVVEHRRGRSGQRASTSRRSSRIWVHAGVDVLDEEAIARLPEKGDHERTTFPELAAEGKLYAFRHEGLWLTVNTPKDLRTRRGAHAREPQLARRGGESMTTESPNLGGLELCIEPTKVDKPWGYELIWALTDDYCGKILFVKAGESLSLQFHREKDESWLIHSGRAEIEMAEPGDKTTNPEVVGPGAAFRITPGNDAPGDRARGHDDPRGLDAADSKTSSGSRTNTDARPNLDTSVLRLAMAACR